MDFVLLVSQADVRASCNFTKNQEQPLVLKYLKFSKCSQAVSAQSQWAKQTRLVPVHSLQLPCHITAVPRAEDSQGYCGVYTISMT